MKDHLIRATAMEDKVRAFAVQTTGTLEELRRRHDLSPVAAAALGRTVSIGTMMGAMLKGEEKLTIQIKGDGPLGQVVVDANAHGEVRGYVDHPEIELPLNAIGKLDVAGAVGTVGTIYVIKDLGLKEPYRGSIPIVSGEIGEDFTYYFAKSEQTPSAVAVGVLVAPDWSIAASGGFIIQVLPGLSDEELADLEARLGEISSVTSLLQEGLDLPQILANVLGPIRVLATTDIVFRCKCSRERVEQTLLSLGRTELESMLHEDGGAEVSCHFCNEAYRFDEEDLRQLLSMAKA